MYGLRRVYKSCELTFVPGMGNVDSRGRHKGHRQRASLYLNKTWAIQTRLDKFRPCLFIRV